MDVNAKTNMNDLFSIQKNYLILYMKLVLSDISPSNCHLLTLDGHGSHIILQAIKLAQQCGLDMITLPTRSYRCI
jgi:hypothetical protein